MQADDLKKLLEQEAPDWERIREIRIRAGRPVTLVSDGCETVLADRGQKRTGDTAVADGRLIREILEIVSKHSLYAFEDEIRQGFLTIEGGHRVGICGKAVLSGDGALRTIKDVSSLNIRLARERKGCADGVIRYLYGADKTVCSTLILSPPGAGKTTLLRDLVRQISDGNRFGDGVPVAVVDERSEIAACFQGTPQCDLGSRTDVMDACPKTEGMYMMIRSMSPRVLAADEIGTAEDLKALRFVMNCGCRIIATAHADSFGDLERRPFFAEMVKEKLFSRYVVLSKFPRPGTTVCVCGADGKAVQP